MGVRGFIRDIISIYLGYEIIRGFVSDDFAITLPILIVTIALFALTIWFILEKIGILPKLTQS